MQSHLPNHMLSINRPIKREKYIRVLEAVINQHGGNQAALVGFQPALWEAAPRGELAATRRPHCIPLSWGSGSDPAVGIPGLLSQKKIKLGDARLPHRPAPLGCASICPALLGFGTLLGLPAAFFHSFCSSLPPLHNHHLSQRCILSPLVPVFVLPEHDRKQFETGGCPGAQHNPAVAGLIGQAGTLISAEPPHPR